MAEASLAAAADHRMDSVADDRSEANAVILVLAEVALELADQEREARGRLRLVEDPAA